jgi:hypothetical protein
MRKTSLGFKLANPRQKTYRLMKHFAKAVINWHSDSFQWPPSHITDHKHTIIAVTINFLKQIKGSPVHELCLIIAVCQGLHLNKTPVSGGVGSTDI